MTSISCNKSTDDRPQLDAEKYPGVAKGLLNGKVWSTYCGAIDQRNGHFGIYADSLDTQFNPFQTLFISNIDYEEGLTILKRYQMGIDTNTYVSFGLNDYDINLAFYYLDSSSFNWVNILELDTLQNIVAASFELDLVLKEGGVRGWPHKLSFKQGEIQTKITDQ